MLRTYKIFIVMMALALAALPLTTLGAEHVIPQAALRQSLVSAAAARRANEAKVSGFFALPAVAGTLKKHGIDARRVERAVPTLSDQELAELAARTEKAQANFAAGALSNEDLTYIVIALATAVLVIIIVKA